MAERRTVRWTSGTDRRLLVELASDAPECIDTHCHLDSLFQRRGGPRYRTLSEYKEQVGGFSHFQGCIAVFEDPRRWSNTSRWTSIIDEPDVWAAFGCHPHRADYFNNESHRLLDDIVRLGQSVKAVGEIGLDYSRNNHVARAVQKQVFSQQLELAVKLGAPVVLHIREAERDAHEIIRRCVPRGHIMHRHCVTGDVQVQQMYIDDYPNCYIGFTGLITNPNAVSARRAVSDLPLERMLLETDAPHFVPHTLRGAWRFSHPGMVWCVANEISCIKSVTVNRVVNQTTYNARRVYDLPL